MLRPRRARPGRGLARAGYGRRRVARPRPRPSAPAATPCFVIRPRCTVVSDSWCFGVSPAHEASCSGPAEATDVADLGDEHRGQHRPDPGDGLDRAVAGVGAQPAGDQLGEQLDLEVQRGDHPQRGVDPGPRLGRQPRPEAQQLLAGRRRTGRSSAPACRRRRARRGPGTSGSSAARPAWPGGAPSRAAPGWPVGRSTPRAAGPSAADRPGPRRRVRRS